MQTETAAELLLIVVERHPAALSGTPIWLIRVATGAGRLYCLPVVADHRPSQSFATKIWRTRREHFRRMA